ncbi:MAG: alanine racemase [Bacteroidales bacterium]|nr:alanine racemase [Bacteroidales bacterium]
MTLLLDSIKQPTLLVDAAKTKKNIIRMMDKATANKAVLRPHFKTHQSGLIGNWFKTLDVDRITVSSVEMAAYFAQHGWNDITIAFPVNIREIRKINHLLAHGIRLNLLVEAQDTVKLLSDAIEHETGVFIKIDSGNKRSGIPIQDTKCILQLSHQVFKSDKLLLKGWLTHAGHTYKATSVSAIRSLTEETVQRLKDIRTQFGEDGLLLSWGDTPSCSVLDEIVGFDEWRPGNFVFYDIMQYHIGSCSLADIAIAVACPIVAVHKERDQLIVYGGSIHFSAEYIAGDSGFRLYGYPVLLERNGWSELVTGAWVRALSQEHGVIQLPKGMTNSFRAGDLIGVLPVHACLTVNAMGKMQNLNGEYISCFR